MQRQRLRILSAGARPVALQRDHRTGDGGRHARHQRDALALFRMAGGGLERLRRHDRADRVTMLLLRQSFEHAGHVVARRAFCIAAAGNRHRDGARVAISRRATQLFDHAPHWWSVGAAYGVAAGIIFVVVVAVSRLGPYGAVCWRDLRVIASRFLPVKVD